MIECALIEKPTDPLQWGGGSLYDDPELEALLRSPWAGVPRPQIPANWRRIMPGDVGAREECKIATRPYKVRRSVTAAGERRRPNKQQRLDEHAARMRQENAHNIRRRLETKARVLSKSLQARA